MRIIKPVTVRNWAAKYNDAATALEKWTVLVKAGRWTNFIALRQVFSSADEVIVESNRRVVIFNIGGNKYRLIAAIHYNTQVVYALMFLTHSEYSKEKWKKVL